MGIIICPNCGNKVLLGSNEICPSCQNFVETNTTNLVKVNSADQNTDVDDSSMDHTSEVFWTCGSCNTINEITAFECKNCLKPNESCEIQIGEEIKKIDSFERFIPLIKKGKINASTKIRRLAGKDRDWGDFEKMKKEEKLSRYFSPITSTSWQYAFIGITVGIVLKGIDTAVLFFAIDPFTGMIWLVTLFGILFHEKLKISSWVIVGAVLFFSFRYGISVNLFVTFFTVVIIGAMFGFPAGMFVGSIVGLVRRVRHLVVSDVNDEKRTVIIYYSILPLVGFVSLVLLYFFWLNPLILKYLE
jgi:hypothetical protein